MGGEWAELRAAGLVRCGARAASSRGALAMLGAAGGAAPQRQAARAEEGASLPRHQLRIKRSAILHQAVINLQSHETNISALKADGAPEVLQTDSGVTALYL